MGSPCAPHHAVTGDARQGWAGLRARARNYAADIIGPPIREFTRKVLLDGIEATRRLAGPGSPGPVKILVVTTFNVDEYVYEALKAGASGFLLKDARAAELVNGIRTVARGESLLAPAVTRALIGQFAGRIRPPPAPPRPPATPWAR